MSLKDKLLKLKSGISILIQKNRDYEFDADFENHPIGEQNIYRLYYVDYRRVGESYESRPDNIHMTNWPCKPFMFPNGMIREDGFKVLSYLTDFIEQREEIEPCSLKSVRTLDSILNLERFGFTRVEETDESKILNLFTVAGRILLFKKSELYSKYFEWYTEGVTLEEVENIYNKCNLEFQDIIWTDSPKEKNNGRILKKSNHQS